MTRPPFLPLLPPALLLLGACATVAPEARGPVDFVRHHYASLRIGTDWERVQEDFARDAIIVRHDPEHPGELIVETVPSFFEVTAPAIDSMRSFRIEPVGIRALVYERLATVMAYVEVESVDADGQPQAFRAVDQFALAMDPHGRWRISHLLYQRVAEGWEPPRNIRTSLFRQSGVHLARGGRDRD